MNEIVTFPPAELSSDRIGELLDSSCRTSQVVLTPSHHAIEVYR